MSPPPSILFVASECASLAKAGGLGDVVASLPAALRALGHDVRVVIPRYDMIPTEGATRHAAPLAVPIGGGHVWSSVLETRLAGGDVPVYMLDQRGLFGRSYIYDPPGTHAADNLSRFGFLSRGALQLCKYLGWNPDVFHVHDWPTAILPIYLNTLEAVGPYGRAASVLTIHNLAYQARFPASQLAATHLPMSELRPDSLEDRGALNLLKGGIHHATKLTTVSPRYAEEIKTPECGAGLDALMRFRAGDLVGILNGIDERAWDPRKDPAIAASLTTRICRGRRPARSRSRGRWALPSGRTCPCSAW
jgi:starch synthase